MRFICRMKNKARKNESGMDNRESAADSERRLPRQTFFQKSWIVFCRWSVIWCLSGGLVCAQEMPDKIRGYKVYKEKVVVQSDRAGPAANEDLRVEVNFDEPAVTDLSLLGVTFDLGGELTVFGQSGTVDFISFKGFKVNDVSVAIEEYREAFDFKKGETQKLKKPVKIFVGAGGILSGALKEWRDSKKIWTVRGRVLVFGRFNKFGIKFKRVIPVDVDLLIENPLAANKINQN